MLTKNDKLNIVKNYKNRKMTIREMANYFNKSYEEVRQYLVSLGYHNGKK